MTAELTVQRLSGDRYRVAVRGHELTVDQPTGGGGTDLGPTPTELFVAGLASCVAFYAGRALRNQPPSTPLAVRCRWTMSAEPPWRVTSILLTVEAPPGLSPERMAALARAASHCTVHNSLADPPDVSLAVMPTVAIDVVPGVAVG